MPSGATLVDRRGGSDGARDGGSCNNRTIGSHIVAQRLSKEKAFLSDGSLSGGGRIVVFRIWRRRCISPGRRLK